MKIIKNILTLVQTLARKFRFPHWPAPAGTLPAPAEQLNLDLDQPTDIGLPLCEALPVRSAELWLQLGQPDRAWEELQTLPETTRQHPWARRVSFDVALANLHQVPA